MNITIDNSFSSLLVEARLTNYFAEDSPRNLLTVSDRMPEISLASNILSGCCPNEWDIWKKAQAIFHIPLVVKVYIPHPSTWASQLLFVQIV